MYASLFAERVKSIGTQIMEDRVVSGDFLGFGLGPRVLGSAFGCAFGHAHGDRIAAAVRCGIRLGHVRRLVRGAYGTVGLARSG